MADPMTVGWAIASRYSSVLASETRDLAAAIDAAIPIWRPIGGGIGNMAGSYDHTRAEVEAELRERIIVGGGYGDLTEDELDRLVGKTWSRRDPLPMVWSPIDTAPVPPREVLKYDLWHCLLQDKKGRVFGGFAAYARIQGKADRWRVQWYAGQARLVGGFGSKVCEPVKWMPMPPAEIEP